MYTEGPHSRFIRTPLASILKNGANACCGVGYGIETYPLCDHVMQSLFLRMTGAQEQKMKCICWELATDDYDFRYRYLGQKNLGEFSTYADKKFVYKEMCAAIEDDCYTAHLAQARLRQMERKKNELEFQKKEVKTKGTSPDETAAIEKRLGSEIKNVNDAIKETEGRIKQMGSQSSTKSGDFAIDCDARVSILNEAIKDTKEFARTVLGYGDEHGRLFFENNVSLVIDKDDFGKTGSLFEKNLENIYADVVYKHRNRCAHNTTSYQENLPTFDSLAQDDYQLCSYYFRFAILLLIDGIFRHLYQEYQEKGRQRFR